MLCGLFCFPFRKIQISSSQKKKWFWVITLSAILYGIIIEFVQDAWVPNRSFELTDIGADSVGAILGFVWSLKKFS
jgi:VanZ family protein